MPAGPLLIALALACSSEPAPSPDAPAAAAPDAAAPDAAAPAADAAAPNAAAPAAGDPEAPSDADVANVLAPSPLALEKELTEAGLEADLAALVPASRFDGQAPTHDVVAIRTGVRTADAILVGESASKEDFVARLKEVREGMGTIGTGEGLLSSFDDVITKVENDAASRADFIAELDGVVTTMVPEEGWGPEDTTGPLVQAGAWLGATDLVAQAIVKAGDDAAADKLLRRAEVARYFLSYARRSDKAPGPARDALVSALETLEQLAAKDEPLTAADAQAVHDAAQKLFGYL